MLQPKYLYVAFILGVIGFQIALTLGAPWGQFTQGGIYPGVLPLPGRIVAATSIIVLTGMALAMLSASGSWPHWPRWTGWVALLLQATTTTLNWITPSEAERWLWGPITSAMLGLALIILIFRRS
ncbi:MAG: hypothetical protein P8X77_05465 [Maritimibacter sp.]